MSKRSFVIHWFRRDLRLQDNRGFAEALRWAEANDASVVPLFIFDRDILKNLEAHDARVTFIHHTLFELKQELRDLKSDLLCASGTVREVWRKFLASPESFGLGPEACIKRVTVCEDYEPLAIARDHAVEKQLLAAQVVFQRIKDQVVFHKNDVTKDDGKPYTVFTPYSKKWREKLRLLQEKGEDPAREVRIEKLTSNLHEFDSGDMPSLDQLGFKKNTGHRIPTKEVETSLLKKYATSRDLPSIAGTSRLGLHLRFGTVSTRKLVRMALKNESDVWLSELIWREFFMQILFHFPHVAEGAFRPEYERIAWRNNENEFEAWKQGKTGFPLVDAGMRELNATGFMHNRVRMVAASFLVKHLLIDWRWGEAYFAEKLLDFDLAANNGNWQWVAGSGCDAAPYFRVFNPELQAKRFDKKNEYIRKWVPEFGTPQQLQPIVDHAEARARVLRAYAVVKNKD